MQCFYINLESAHARRTGIEANFAAVQGPGWSLARFAALDTAYVASHNVPGSLKPTEKACFLSHKTILEKNLQSSKPIWILEDDALFGKNTCAIVDGFFQFGNNFEWDILFTDVCFTQIDTMAELVRARRKLMAKQQATMLDLASYRFGGATSYIVNPASIQKVFALLEAHKSLDIPYDLYLRKLIHEKQIKSFVFFPFITSLSDQSEASQIQAGGKAATDLVWNTFRKLVWTERDVDAVMPIVEQIDAQVCDDDSRLFECLLSAMVSAKFIGL